MRSPACSLWEASEVWILLTPADFPLVIAIFTPINNIIRKNKSYTNPKIGDLSALSRIFNNTSPYCGSSVYKPPHMTKVIRIIFNLYFTPFKVYLDYILNHRNNAKILGVSCWAYCWYNSPISRWTFLILLCIPD